MNYFELVKNANPGKTAIIEDGKPYTYRELLAMAHNMSQNILKDSKNSAGNGYTALSSRGLCRKNVFIIKEESILKQLVAFLACNAARIIPVIAPYDIVKLPEINDVPRDACMAVMTSGTTGVPKILYRTYKSWADFFQVQNRIFGIDRESRLFVHGSLAFTGNLNIYMAQFYTGGTVVAENKFNPRRWAHAIKEGNVNSIYLIPSKLMLLPDVIKEADNNIKSIISGSQSLGLDDAKKLKKIFPLSDITLYYGASELNYITYVKDKDMTADKTLVGKPFPDVKVSVDNGIIYVDSRYHVEGIKCPYSVSDNGYMDKDGNLYFKGRSDDIVLIHGRKISLTNIENELEKLETVQEAAAIPVMEKGKCRITAFIATSCNIVNNNSSSGKTSRKSNDILKKLPGNDNIFTILRKTLAHYEMPCKIIVLNQIPHNGSGKKDKKKILEMYKQETLN